MQPAPPDPRLFQKNFAMPMNPAGVRESELPVVRRKDGAPVAVANLPGYGDELRTTSPTSIRQQSSNDVPPLFCTLYRKTDGSRSVTVSEGAVIEVIPKSGTGVDGVIEHDISNIWAGNLLMEHGIETGQSVGIAYTVDERGNITGTPAVAVRSAGAAERSLHYQPPVGSNAGAPGDVYVILARLTGSGSNDRLEVFHGGSNIEHIHELAPFRRAETATGVHVMKHYAMPLGQYEYFGIKGLAPIAVSQSGDDVVVEMDASAGNLDLIVKSRTITVAAPTVVKINIPSLVVTGSTGAGEGTHTHTGVILEKANLSGIAITGDTDLATAGGDSHRHAIGTGALPAYTVAPVSDSPIVFPSATGAHTHSVTGTTTAVTTDSPTTRQEITIPGAVTITNDTAYYTLCWRKGIFVGKIDDAGAVPAHEGTKIIKTIYTLGA